MRPSRSDSEASTRSSCPARSDALGAGSATSSRQQPPGGRAVQPDAVRCLRPMSGDGPAALAVHARAALSLHASLTHRGTHAQQGNGPQMHPSVALRQEAHRPRARARSLPTTSSRCGGCERLAAATLSRARAACIRGAHTAPSGPDGLDLRGWAARNAALVGGLEHCHGVGRTGGACRDEGDQCPLLWRAWRSPAFSCFWTIRRGCCCKKCNVCRATVVRNVAPICSYCSQDLTLASYAGLGNKNHRSSLKNVSSVD